MRDQIRRTATYIYIHVNIYTRNLKFAQLVTALASLANKYKNIYTRNLKFAQLMTALAPLANYILRMSFSASNNLLS